MDSMPVKVFRIDPDFALAAALLSTADGLDSDTQDPCSLQNGFSFRDFPSPAGGLKNHLTGLHFPVSFIPLCCIRHCKPHGYSSLP